MTKVHPNVASTAAGEVEVAAAREEKALAVSLTVWRRSLLFNGKGFTVFDCKGNLAYRVEITRASHRVRSSSWTPTATASSPSDARYIC
jgi:hypothetical protein